MIKSKPLMVSRLADWRKLFSTPKTKKNQCGITRPNLIEKVFLDVAETELRQGISVIEAIHQKISRYLDIDYEDDDDFVWNELRNAPDPFLRKTLGREMLEWVRTESGLMDCMSFRILIGSQVEAFRSVVEIMLPQYYDKSLCSDLSSAWNGYQYDRLKTAGLNERGIMDMIIIPLFMCYRQRLARFSFI